MILVPRQITEDRGIELAIKAFGKVLDSRDDVILKVAGKAHHESYLNKCRSLAADLGIQDKVVFCPPAAHRDMPALYSAAALTLIPTLRREGTSFSALESMSCGTATVSTNVAGLADIPTLQAAANPDDLAAAILSALNDREAIGAAQQRKVHETFNMKNWNRAWLDVVRGVANTSRQ